MQFFSDDTKVDDLCTKIDIILFDNPKFPTPIGRLPEQDPSATVHTSSVMIASHNVFSRVPATSTTSRVKFTFSSLRMIGWERSGTNITFLSLAKSIPSQSILNP